MQKVRRIEKSSRYGGGSRTPLRAILTMALTAALWLICTAVAFAAESHGGPGRAANWGDPDSNPVIIATFVVIGAIAVAVVVSGLRHPRKEQAQVAPAVPAAARSVAGERRTLAA